MDDMRPDIALFQILESCKIKDAVYRDNPGVFVFFQQIHIITFFSMPEPFFVLPIIAQENQDNNGIYSNSEKLHIPFTLWKKRLFMPVLAEESCQKMTESKRFLQVS